MIYICGRLTHKDKYNMSETMIALTKRAEYRIAELVGNIPAARLTEEKQALAAQLGISIAQLNRIVRGDSDPSGTQLRIISVFLGVSVDDLYATEVIAE